MIELIGIPGSHEYEVALAIKDAFVAQWPGIDTTPAAEELVKIAANAKLAGYQVSDVDIAIAGVFNRPRHFVVRKPIKDKDGRPAFGVKARVQNFACAIEVKGQDGDGISVNGDEVSVRYKGSWKSATDQNVKQVHALKAYFEHQHLDVYVYRCLVLDGINALPKVDNVTRPEAGAVSSGFTAGELLASMAGVNGIGKWNGEHVVSSGRNEVLRRVLDAPIFRQVVATRLDRARMDRVAARKDEADEIAALLGKQRVHIRGHGGTGKTVLMMQAAHRAYELHGRRCLVLTYNTALAGDIKRLLFLLGVPSSHEGGGVDVRTAMSFVYAWLARLELKHGQQSFDRYEEQCAECLEMIEGGAIAREEITRIIDADPEAFDYDAIIVDEGQDWPQPEARLLAALYGGEKVAIADGREQLLRGRPTDWSRTLEQGQASDERSLTRCLRMKRNLGIFANSVARLAGLNWQIEPNDEAAGGKVIIVLGSYADDHELVARLLREAREAGNEEVDFLHCVPPSNVLEKDGVRTSKLGSVLESLGHSIWNGVDEAARRDFPRSPDLLRVLQYDSSRGLEGWTTVLEHLDEAWDYKRGDWRAQHVDDAFAGDPDRAAQLAAWRWCMIPLTRPMDTLVITLSNAESSAATLVLKAADENPDFVEVIGR
jgi:hypothetical protein